MGASLTQAIRFVLEGDPKGAKAALGDVGKSVGDLDKQTKSFGDRMNTAANYGAGALVGLVGVLGLSARKFNEVGEGIDTVTDLTNLSTEAASLLSAQFARFGVDATAGGNAVKFYEKNLDFARQGNELMIEAFERLGISMTELQTLDDAEILARTRDGLVELDDKTARTAISLQLFGRGGAALADWLEVAPGDMAKMNDQLERSGLVWGDEEMRRWQEALDAQREMQIALTGIQTTIGRDVVPALTPFVELLGGLLRALRPISPVLVPLTGALAIFVGAVKAVRIVKEATGWVGGFYRVLKNGDPITAARLAIEKLTPALAISAVQWGLVAGAAAGAAIAIWQAYDAAKQYQDAMAQVNAQTEANLKAIDELIAKYREEGRDVTALLAQREQIIADSKVSTPWYYYLNPAYDVMDFITYLQTGMASGGTVKASPGGSVVIAGEGGEDEDVVPASKRASYARSILGSGGVLNINIDKVMGTDRRAAEEFAGMVGDVLMGRILGEMAGQNA